MSFIYTGKFEGSALECARLAAGMDIIELSEVTGIGIFRLTDIEVGKMDPSEAEIINLCAHLGVNRKFFIRAWIKPPAHAYNFRGNAAVSQ